MGPRWPTTIDSIAPNNRTWQLTRRPQLKEYPIVLGGAELEGPQIVYALVGALVGALVASWIGAYLGHITAAHVDRHRAIEDAATSYIAAVRVLVQVMAQEHIFARRLAEASPPSRIVMEGMLQGQTSGLKGLELIKAVHPYILNLVEAHSIAGVAVAHPNDALQAKIFEVHRLMNTEVMTSSDPFAVYNSKVARYLESLEDLLRERRRRGWLRSIWMRA
jgi:hypothetical protein